MTEYKELRGVGRSCGNYPAWHEMSIYCEYIYGRLETLDDSIGETVCDELDCEWDDLEKQDVKLVDAIAQKSVDECDGDYCYSDNMMFLCKIVDGKVVKSYLSI